MQGALLHTLKPLLIVQLMLCCKRIKSMGLSKWKYLYKGNLPESSGNCHWRRPHMLVVSITEKQISLQDFSEPHRSIKLMTAPSPMRRTGSNAALSFPAHWIH